MQESLRRRSTCESSPHVGLIVLLAEAAAGLLLARDGTQTTKAIKLLARSKVCLT